MKGGNFMKIRLAIVDNDETARAELCKLLRFYGLFEIAAEFDDVNQASDYLLTCPVDAVFINLQVGNYATSGDGSYLAFHLSERCPDMIVALYSPQDYQASYVFRMNCAEFFTLPFDALTLQRVVNRIRYRYELLQFRRQTKERSVMVKMPHGYQMVALDSVLFIERYNRKNRMITTDGREIILNGYTMDELTKLLIRDGFYRCYQSYIVNLSKVSGIRADNAAKNYSLQFDGYAGEVLLSRDQYSDIIRLLKENYAKISL